MIQSRRNCRSCGRKTLHARATLGTGWGCLLTVLTAGLFLPIWLLIGVWEGLAVPWRCQECGQGRRS